MSTRPSRSFARKVLVKRKAEVLDGKHFPDRIKKTSRALVKLDEKSRGEKQALHWHDLRHTFASRLAMQGVPTLAINKLLRHSEKDLSVTLRYAHLAPEHLVEELGKLDQFNAKCQGSVKPVFEMPATTAQIIN